MRNRDGQSALTPSAAPSWEAAENEITSNRPGLAAQAGKIGKLGSIYLLAVVAERLIGICLLPIFTHYLVPAQMGIVSLASQVSRFLMVFLQLGVLGALWRHYFHTDPAERPELIRSVTSGQILQIGVLCVGLSIVGIWVSDALLPNLPLPQSYIFGLWMMIVWSCFLGAMILTAIQLLRFQERAIRSVVLELLRYVCQVGLGVTAVVWLGWQGFGRQGTIFLGTVIAGVAAIVVLWRLGRGGFRISVYLGVLRTGVTYIPHSLSGVLGPTVTAWLLNKMVSSTALGVYGIAMMFSTTIVVPLSAFRSAAYPTLAESMRAGDAGARRQHARLLTLLNIGMVWILLGVWLFARPAVVLLTAPAYHEAASVVSILVIAWLFQAFLVSVQPPLLFLGRGLLLSSGTISALLTTITLCFLLIPRYEIYGAAWAVAGGYATRFVMIAIISSVVYPLPWEWGKTLRLLVCCGVLGWVAHSLESELSLWWEIAAKVALFLSVLPALRVLRVITTREISQLLQLIATKLRWPVGITLKRS